MAKGKFIYFVAAPDGKFWNETVATDHRQCQLNFVRGWFSGIPEVKPGSHEAWTVWQMFERAGWEIREIELP